jgi:glycerol kinase
MKTSHFLAIDQGTTNTKAVLVDTNGRILAKASAPLISQYPRPGWAEQSADDIWDSVQKVIAIICEEHELGAVVGLAISNQRETLIVFDAETGRPLGPAILWQCRRTAADCAELRQAGHDPAVVKATGLSINPLFPASKLGWVMRNIPEAKALAHAGRLRAGTVDSWLLYKLTNGAVFATDHSNASRTQLFNTARLEWDEDLCALFGAPLDALPDPHPSDSEFGRTAGGATSLPAGVPILAIMGDSHAALYGHGVRSPGLVKATYGTGSSLMTLTKGRLPSGNGLSSTIAWTDRSGTHYALEGNITVSAQAAAFAASLLGLRDAAALSDLAQSVPHSSGVVFVPALSGLGAPHWNDFATGTITGMTLGTRPAHLARATFEAVALQIADVFSAMERDIGHPLDGVLADGGASSNSFLMQLQADLINRTVSCGELAEVGAIGSAAMGLANIGCELSVERGDERRFTPRSTWNHEREAILSRWQKAIRSVIATSSA